MVKCSYAAGGRYDIGCPADCFRNPPAGRIEESGREGCNGVGLPDGGNNCAGGGG